MQTTLRLTPEKLSRLAPRDIHGYVRSRGWVQSDLVGRLRVFNRPEPDSLDQVLVPVDAARPDYSERVWDALAKLSKFESRPPEALYTDLSNYDADVLRYRVVSKQTERGTLPLVEAIELLSGARQSLLAAAHSVLVPAKYHPKLSRTQAVQLLDKCELNQTEQRSFVVAISCPIRAVDADEAGIDVGEMPFTRRATLVLRNALARLDRAIAEDRVSSIVDDENPIVSANLCDALLKMRPRQDGSMLEFTPTWASSTELPAMSAELLGSITFSEDEFEAVEDLYRQLRPTESPEARPWIGYVDELKGGYLEDGTREGEVVLRIVDEDEIFRARATLTREQYKTACDAHNPVKPLFLKGILHRGPRVSRLSQVTDLRAVPQELWDNSGSGQ